MRAEVFLDLLGGEIQLEHVADDVEPPDVLDAVHAVAVRIPAWGKQADLLIIAQRIRRYAVKRSDLADLIISFHKYPPKNPLTLV